MSTIIVDMALHENVPSTIIVDMAVNVLKRFSRFMSQTELNLSKKKVAAHFEPVMNANY